MEEEEGGGGVRGAVTSLLLAAAKVAALSEERIGAVQQITTLGVLTAYTTFIIHSNNNRMCVHSKVF